MTDDHAGRTKLKRGRPRKNPGGSAGDSGGGYGSAGFGEELGDGQEGKAPGVQTEGQEGERSESGWSGGRTPGAAAETGSSARPDPEVVAQAKRRTFSVKYKLWLLSEADRCGPGELGALLRREAVYDSTYRRWLTQRDEGILSGLEPRRRGPAPAPVNPLAKRVAELERENRKLTRKLSNAELIIDVQKKVASLLGITMEPEEKGKKE